MLLNWFDPFREFDRITQRMLGTASSAMPMDAFRHGDSYIVAFDLPGVDPASVDVTLERNVLTVSAERRWDWSDDQTVYVAERPQGRFTRQIMLSEALDTDHVEASYDNGVLTVAIPVREQAKPKRIEIAQGGSTTAIEAEAAPANA